MTSPIDRHGEPRRRARPFRRIRKAVKRLRKGIAIRLGSKPVSANRGYIICATPRSGSSYLCELLTSTNLLGRPLEYFNTPGRRKRSDPKYPKDPRAQIDIIRTVGATPNGIYGVKLLASQTKRLKRIDPFRTLPNLVVFRLSRADVLAQAISLARAMLTRQFISSDTPRMAAVYDERLIRRCLHRLREQEALWDGIMDDLGAAPPSFEYEDVVKNPQSIVDQIASQMELPQRAMIDNGMVTHAVQRDATSAAWRLRFLADTGDEFRHLAG
jgi:LPS sulfotransferase NodH